MAFIPHTMKGLRPAAGWEVKVKLWICIQLLRSLRSCQALQPLPHERLGSSTCVPEQWESPRSPAEGQQLKGCRRMERAGLYKPTTAPVCSFGTAKPRQKQRPTVNRGKANLVFCRLTNGHVSYQITQDLGIKLLQLFSHDATLNLPFERY